MLKKQCDIANNTTSQHNINEFTNQLLVLDRLDHLYEKGFLDKCMLSAYLLITRDFQNNVMAYISLPTMFMYNVNNDKPIIWLRSIKLPVDGEGLADKGFEFLDRLFTHFNQVRCSHVL